MQAIQTRYLGPTNKRGARIKAFCQAKEKVITDFDYRLDADVNHITAAKWLARKLEWLPKCNYHLESGSLPNGDMAHILVRD